MAGLKTLPFKEVAQYLKEAFKRGELLYRHESFPRELFEGGIKTDLPSYRLSGEEPIGLYFSKNLRELPSLATGGPTPWRRYYKPYMENVQGGKRPLRDIIMRAALTPEAKIGRFNPKEWNAFLQELEAKAPSGMSEEAIKGRIQRSNKDYVGDSLREMGYDAVEFPDVVVGQPHLKQTTVLKPGKTLVQWKDIAGLLGVGGVAAGAVLGDTKEAEAMPLGPQVKGVFKTFGDAMKGPLKKEMKSLGQKIPAKSGAHDQLVGAPFRGSVISGVYQGAQNSRYIHTQDGRIWPIDKKSLGLLVSNYQTAVYRDKFLQKEGSAKLEHARKSLRHHLNSYTPFSGFEGYKTRFTSTLTDIMGMTQNPSLDQVMVQSLKEPGKGWFLMPREQAELLKQAGDVRISDKFTVPQTGGK